MQFTYEHEFRSAFPVGSRTWVCCVVVAKNGVKIVKHMPPTLVESCASTSPTRELEFREKGYPPQYLVPVNSNGTLAFNDATTYAHLHFNDTEEAAIAAYQKDLETAFKKIDNMSQWVSRTKSKIEKIQKDFEQI